MSSGAARCSVCTHADRELAETAGAEALAGAISWRQAALPFGVRHEQLKRHMEAHVVAPAEAELSEQEASEFDALVARAKDGLLEQFDYLPPDIRPLLLIATHNLDGIKRSRASMETLIKALKAIQEMTGMKQEQRLMLEMARNTRRPKPIKVKNEAPALEAGEEVE